MANPSTTELKTILLAEVDAFCRAHIDARTEVGEFLESIRANRWPAVFFGGTLRSLLVDRFFHDRRGRPRDLDIVFRGPKLASLRDVFGPLITRETRFGGLQLRKGDWQFDVWPLDQTWAIREDGVSQPGFDHLPRTTFLNVEAVAVDVWPTDGERRIYSDDDRFFQAIRSREVEINRSENPYPELCVVRSLLMAHDLEFRVGPELTRFISSHGTRMDLASFDRVQTKHYGHIRIPSAVLRSWVEDIANYTQTGDSSPSKLRHPTFHGFVTL
jgi:hypothetical protein